MGEPVRVGRRQVDRPRDPRDELSRRTSLLVEEVRGSGSGYSHSRSTSSQPVDDSVGQFYRDNKKGADVLYIADAR